MSVSKWLVGSLVVSAIAGALSAGCAAEGVTDDPGDDAGNGVHVDAGDAAAQHDAGGDTGGGSPGDGAADDDASGPDGGAPDATPDATLDASDAGAQDASVPDANGVDSDIPDTNVPDTNIPDTNVPDTNIPDTNIPDTNVPDTNIPDASVPDTSVPDAGVCPPVLNGFSPVYHAPPANPHACTAANISSFYTSCLASTSTTTCNTWQLSVSSSCANCLLGNIDAAGTKWGPIVQYASAPYVYSNQGGCVALANPTASTCAHDIEYELECEHAACDTGCTGAATADYDACTAAAAAGVCASYVAATNADCANVSSVCFGGADFQANFKQVAATFCQ